MSSSLRADQSIAPFNLLQESIAQVGPIYWTLFILTTPFTILTIAEALTKNYVVNRGLLIAQKTFLSSGISILQGLIVTPILVPVILYFVYRYCKERTIDIQGAFRHGLSKSAYALLGLILFVIIVIIGLVLLVIPGIYVMVLLGFFLYALTLENTSLPDSFKRSAALVKGRWWPVFGSMLVGTLWIFPLIAMGIIMGIILALAGLDLKQISIASTIAGALMGTVLTPFLNLYYVKLFIRLQEINMVPQDQ